MIIKFTNSTDGERIFDTATVGQLDPTPVETAVVRQLIDPPTLAKFAGARYDKRMRRWRWPLGNTQHKLVSVDAQQYSKQ